MTTDDRTTRRRLIALSGAVCGTVLAGCGDEGPGETEDTGPQDDPEGGPGPATEEDAEPDEDGTDEDGGIDGAAEEE